MTKYLLPFLFIILLYSSSKAEQTDLGLSLKLNKSLGLIPFGSVELNKDDNKELSLLNGTFGIAADLLYKSKRRIYFNLSLEYNSLVRNDDFLDLNGKELNGNFVKIGFNGIGYMEPPDEFTPYLGYGFGFLFINTNQDELITYDSDEYEPITGDLFSPFTISIDIKAGLLIPINENFSVTADIDFGIYFAKHLGLIPKLQVGSIYWIR